MPLRTLEDDLSEALEQATAGTTRSKGKGKVKGISSGPASWLTEQLTAGQAPQEDVLQGTDAEVRRLLRTLCTHAVMPAHGTWVLKRRAPGDYKCEAPGEEGSQRLCSCGRGAQAGSSGLPQRPEVSCSACTHTHAELSSSCTVEISHLQ